MSLHFNISSVTISTPGQLMLLLRLLQSCWQIVTRSFASQSGYAAFLSLLGVNTVVDSGKAFFWSLLSQTCAYTCQFPVCSRHSLVFDQMSDSKTALAAELVAYR